MIPPSAAVLSSFSQAVPIFTVFENSKDRHTDWISAPFAPDPLTLVTDLELSVPRFCLFTTICDDPKASEAGRFSEDMVEKSPSGLRYSNEDVVAASS